ncbi:MAG: sulfite exporter TauE/SafE family protein [Gemmatimonadota bacterium]|jgi:hypothetical protein|nr:sulfite exporter TauE/SafE family protein [Gemmatimonadota bacterium]MDP7030788.1 sulfite exporter TauE/SafE family protein [Gemmatimonadota bacterium]
MMDSPAWIPALFAAGAVAGFFNTVGGGGSLFTLPLLLLLGLPPQVANGTNRVAIVMQNLVAVPSYARRGFFFPRDALLLVAPALPMALLGAWVAARIDPEPFRLIAAGLLLAVVGTLFVRPASWGRAESSGRSFRPSVMLPLAAVIGFYGGFLQAGVGIPLLALLVLGGGFDLVSANAIKVVVVLLYTVPSVGVFADHAQVDWSVGIPLGAGNMVGAWWGARMAVRRGPKWIRAALVVMAVLAAARLIAG